MKRWARGCVIPSGRIGALSNNEWDELPIATSGIECSPTGITAGPDGNVWFTCELADQIGRITVPKPTPPGPAPAPAAVTAEPRFTG